jgi:response regulator RpfG family c-di-GMP phosphodiesterase
VISYFGKNQEPRYGVFTVTPLFGKHGNVERAICVVRRIEEQKLEETKRRIILKEVVGQFNERTAAHYENVIYISPNKDWFQQVQTRNDSFPETGSIKEFLEVLEASLKPEDYKQLLSAYRSYKSEHTEEKRNEITSIRFRSKGNTDTYRWKEVSIYPHASVEDADSYILAIADIDDDVKEENRIKRHDTNKQIIEVLSTIVEYRDLESGEHIRRIEDLSEILLRTYTAKNPDDGFTEEEIKIIVAASAMHDIGKIAISDTILLKPGKLTREEYDSMKEHTIKGSELVNTVASIQDQDYARYCYEICRYHHERYDGNGYPDGLAGDEIPIAAQIVSVADVYDALVSKRCYKDAYSKEQAFQMILNGECGVFSDRILQCFIDSRAELEALYA